MIRGVLIRKVWLAAMALACAFGFAPLASGQSCALCYTTASAAGSAGIHALHVGILALLVPALLLFVGVFALVFRSAGSSGV